jgi:hypothetical protein
MGLIVLEEKVLVVSQKLWGSDPKPSTEDPPWFPPEISLTK